MYKLGLLIVCLLVGFRGISQIDTKKNDSVVTLTDRIARKVATDLVHYDSCKQIVKEQGLRINNYQNKEVEYNNKLSIKDSIIFYQRNIIDNQSKIIKNKKSFEIHGYAGVQSIGFSLLNPIIYANAMFELPRFNIGAQYYVQPNKPSGYGIILEYKLF